MRHPKLKQGVRVHGYAHREILTNVFISLLMKKWFVFFGAV